MVKSCCAFNCTERANGSNPVSFHRFPKHAELRQKWIRAIKRGDFTPNENTRICGKHFRESDYIIQFGKRQLKKEAIPSVFNFPAHSCKNEKNRRIRILKRRRLLPTSVPEDTKKQIDDCVSNTQETLELEGNRTILKRRRLLSTSVSEDTYKQIDDCVSNTQETLELEENRRILKRRRLLPISVSEDTNKQIIDCVSNTQETVELCPQQLPQTSLKISSLEEPQEVKKFKRNEREPVYFGDYKLANLKTSEAKKLWHIARNQISKYRTTIKTLRVKQHRLIKKVKSLDDLVNHLKKSG